jgi:hypothetical protein
MYKRQPYTHASQSKDDDDKLKKVKKNPVEQIFSTLPQLAISSAILLFVFFTHDFPHFYNQR